MVDYNELRKKFRAKKPAGDDKDPLHRKSSRAAVKAIAREYEMKKAELQGSGAPAIKRGPVFYLALIAILAIVGGLVLSRGDLSLGKKRIERKPLMARKAMDSLSVALGRYKFHVGAYPTTEEGLKVLAYRRPEEIRAIRRQHKTWDGPYVNHIVNDPWGHEYVYETRPEGGNPSLYSGSGRPRGHDGRRDARPALLRRGVPRHDLDEQLGAGRAPRRRCRAGREDEEARPGRDEKVRLKMI